MKEGLYLLFGIIWFVCLFIQAIAIIVLILKFFRKKNCKKMIKVNLLIFIIALASLIITMITGCWHSDYETIKEIESTCAYKGYTLNYCNDCESEFKRDYVDKLSHNYIEISVVDSTEDYAGEVIYKCSVCGEQKSESIKKLPKAKEDIEVETPANNIVAKVEIKDFYDRFELVNYIEDDYYKMYYYSYDLELYEYPGEKELLKFIEDKFKMNKSHIKKGCVEFYIGYGVDDKIIAFAFRDGVKNIENIKYTTEEEYNVTKSVGEMREKFETAVSKDNIVDNLYLILEDTLVDNLKLNKITYENNIIEIYTDVSDMKKIDVYNYPDSVATKMTSRILDYDELDEYWDSIIIIFEGVGYLELDKSMVINSVYGRYISYKDMNLIKY